MNKILKGIGIGLAIIVFLIGAMFVIKSIAKNRGLPDLKSIEALINDGKLDEAKGKIDAVSEKRPDAMPLGKVYFALAKSYEDKKEIVKARDIYQLILKKYPNINNIIEAHDLLGRLNVTILFSNIVTDKDILYEVEPGDTLTKLAKKFGTTVELIKLSNSFKTDSIKAWSKIKVSKLKYKILVDKSQNILTLLANDEIVKVYRVSTGENNCTPVGNFKIITKIVDPVWYTQNAIVPAESPDNILGSRWLGISMPGYGIHGTAKPESIGIQATKGCVRMLNSDVEELYTIVPVGTEVTIVD